MGYRDSHVHPYFNRTSFDVGHYHRMKRLTGPSVYAGAGHFHRMSGRTTVDEGHSHHYANPTGLAFSSGPRHTHGYRGVTAFAGRGPHVHTYRSRTGGAIY